MENQKAELLKSWVQVANYSDFTIYNLPFGIFRNKKLSPRVGVAIGDKVVDLYALQEAGFFQDIKLADDVFLQDSLNPFIALGKSTTKKVRERVQQLLNEDNTDLKDHQSRGKIMVGLKETEMMLPLKVTDCTAFLSPSEQSLIRNVARTEASGSQLVPLESQRKVSTIIPSGTSFCRPKGPIRTIDKSAFEFGSSRQLDFELEIAFVAGRSTRLGESIAVGDGEDYIFGMVLFNDWTARDMQAEEGALFSPSSKSFASSISLWVVTLEALEYFRVPLTSTDQQLMPYLKTQEDYGFDIELQAYLKPEKGEERLLCQTNFKHAYWSASQLLAQQTVNGSNIEIGDLIVSGTASRSEEGYCSSILEASSVDSAMMEDGSSVRKFIQDGDSVLVKGFAEKEGVRLGFGEMMTKILPSK